MEEQISQWAQKVFDHIAARAQGGVWEETRGEVAKAAGLLRIHRQAGPPRAEEGRVPGSDRAGRRPG